MPEVLTATNTNITSKKDLAKPNLNNASTAKAEAQSQNLGSQRDNLENLFNADADLSQVPDLEKDLIENNQDLNSAVEESLSEDKPDKFGEMITNFMKVVTTGAIAFNGLSAANDGVEEKTGSSHPVFGKMFDSLAMAANKGQATGFGVDVLKEAFERKDATLLIAGFGKVFQILMANSEDFLQLGGIQTSFDQLKPGCEKLIGKSKFNSFGESFMEYFKAIKTVVQEMIKDPMGYLTLNPKSGKVEQVLVPGSMVMLGGTIGCMLSGENKVLRTISSVFRHVIGGVLGGDVILARISDNKDLNLSGLLYGAASIIDTAVTPLKDKLSTMGHKIANMIYFGAEYLFLKGLKQDVEHQANPGLVAQPA
ncbi:MAG: hypothetical protein HRT47_00590 [Candidatus Caenarcaniphilales bacterium]|nr:hypothetical protein [Candidatus Caenarcaniphilales bacterium]